MRRPSSRISPRGDAAGRLEQADDGVAGQRLARARFAHHAQHLAGRDVERHVVDREQRAAPRRELDAQVLHLEQRRIVGAARPSSSDLSAASGLSASRSQSPSRFTASTSAASVTPGKTRDPPVARLQDLVAEADQRAERGLGRGQADAEERQRRLGDDGEAEIDGGDHQHRAGDVGQHVADHDQRPATGRSRGPPGRTPCSSRPAPSRARCGRTAPRSERPIAPTMTKIAISSWRCTEIDAAHDAVDQQRHQDRREGELHVGDAHDHRVDRAADIAAEQAERDAEHHGDDDRGEADDQRQPRAVHDRGQDVPALVVGAEREGPVAVVATAAPAASAPSLRLSVAGSNGVCGASTGDRKATAMMKQRDRGRDHRHRRGLEAPPDVAVGSPMQPSRHGRARRHLSVPPRAPPPPCLRRRGSTAK